MCGMGCHLKTLPVVNNDDAKIKYNYYFCDIDFIGVKLKL